MIRALIFDFDGLIVDTETPEYEGWRMTFREYGHDLPLSVWVKIIGTGRREIGFDPVSYLAELTNAPLDRQAMEEAAERHRLEEIARRPILPGVMDHLEAARQRGLKLGVASSSSREWVVGHLQRLGLLGYFDAVCTKTDVGGRVKPAPDVFLAVLAALGVAPDEAIVYEDSEPGVRAAKAAGIFTVAVPIPLTSASDLSGADLRLGSLADLSLADVLRLAQNGRLS